MLQSAARAAAALKMSAQELPVVAPGVTRIGAPAAPSHAPNGCYVSTRSGVHALVVRRRV
jgi:hypothetical protein